MLIRMKVMTMWSGADHEEIVFIPEGTNPDEYTEDWAIETVDMSYSWEEVAAGEE